MTIATKQNAESHQDNAKNEIAALITEFMRHITGCRQKQTAYQYALELDHWQRWCEREGHKTIETAASAWPKYRGFRCISAAKSCWRKNAQTHRAFWRWMTETGQATESPIKITFLPKRQYKRREPPADNAFEAFLREEHPPKTRSLAEQAFVEMLASSGARISEILNLARANLDLGAKEATGQVKGGQKGKMRFNARTVEALKTWLEKGRPLVARNWSPDTGLLTMKGKAWPITHGAAVMKRRCLKRGIKPIVAHQLRHRYASKLLAAGAKLTEGQKLLNHQSLASTLVYLHTTEEQAAEAHRLLPTPSQKEPHKKKSLRSQIYGGTEKNKTAREDRALGQSRGERATEETLEESLWL